MDGETLGRSGALPGSAKHLQWFLKTETAGLTSATR